MIEFVKQVTSNVWSLSLVVLFFGGSVFVHELGHFLAARRRGLKIDRFSIGFGPKIFGWTRDGVEYRVSWIPLGGYVALPQLAEMRGIEGESSEDVESLPPISYTSKMIVAVMGAVFNVIFAFGLACTLWVFGLPTTDSQNTTVVGYVYPTLPMADGSETPSPAANAGLREGDRILAIDGKEISDWNGLLQTLVSGTDRDSHDRPRAVLTIERDGARMDLELSPRLSAEDGKRKIGVVAAEPLIADRTLENSPAALAGVRRGDRLVSADGKRIHSYAQLHAYVLANADRDIAFTFTRIEGRTFASLEELQQFIAAAGSTEDAFSTARGGRSIEVTMHPAKVKHRTDEPPSPDIGLGFFIPRRIIHQNPLEQISENFILMARVLGGLLNPRSDIGLGDMSGAPGIFRVLYATSQIDIRLVVWVTMLINLNLAVFNLLPIPVLDGGHMLFATLTKLRGRALPARFITTAQSAFMVLLLSLMAFVSFKDIGRWFRDSRDDKRDRQSYIEPVFEKPAKP